MEKQRERVILHSDLNNFYASVACRLQPELCGEYVAVCGSAEERHGIVLAKNQKAKACGVTTGEPIWRARQKCPFLVVVPPQPKEYEKFSRAVQEVYLRYTDLVEPFGIDECWLDVTGSRFLFGSGIEIAEKIRREVKKETGLTVSVGVSYNKVFAKLCSDLKKPDAVTCIRQEEMKQRIWPLPAAAMLGVGGATKKMLERFFIHTIGELALQDKDTLRRRMGINGERLWYYANGLDDAPVMPFSYHSPIKSVSRGITCIRDLETRQEVLGVILELSRQVAAEMRKHGLKAAGVQLSVKDKNLGARQYQTRMGRVSDSYHMLAETAFALFEKRYDWRLPVRAVTVGGIMLRDQTAPEQLDFFTDSQSGRQLAAEYAEGEICQRFGENAVFPARLLCELPIPRHWKPSILPPGFGR